MNASPESPVESYDVWQRPFVKVHRAWCDDLILELRLRDVPGVQIGDHLAEVESHCIETGTDPQEAFGDPTEYARELAVADEPAQDSGVARVSVISLLGLVVFLTGQTATSRWASGEGLSLNLAQLICLAVMVAGLAAVPPLLGTLLRQKKAGVAYFAGLFLVGALWAISGLLPLEPILSGIPAAPVAIGGFVLLCLLSALEARELGDGDWVTSPLRAPEGARSPVAAWRVQLIAWILPIAYVLLGLVSWLFA